ncbi:MAG: peptidylprolyl isomerase [bacterium]|nr:peptidylprolyl isomerase [bacterium]
MDNTGRRVKVHYIGTFDDGWQFDSSYDNGEPIEFVCMNGDVIEGFDQAVRDMEVGQTIKVHVPVEMAYGERDEEAIQKLPRALFPDADKLPVGKHIYTQDGKGGFMPVLIVAVDEYEVTLDVNHPMAGQALNFELTLLESEEIPKIEYPEYVVPGQPLKIAEQEAQKEE